MAKNNYWNETIEKEEKYKTCKGGKRKKTQIMKEKCGEPLDISDERERKRNGESQCWDRERETDSWAYCYSLSGGDQLN